MPYLTEVWYWQEFLQFRQKLPHKELHVCVVAEAIFCWKNLLGSAKVTVTQKSKCDTTQLQLGVSSCDSRVTCEAASPGKNALSLQALSVVFG